MIFFYFASLYCTVLHPAVKLEKLYSAVSFAEAAALLFLLAFNAFTEHLSL